MTASSTNRARLTIAIPTYNRQDVLAQCLDTLAAQLTANPALASRVDILVVDNASTDGTEAMVLDMQRRMRCLTYVRNKANYGIDGNIHRCALYATGTYVHLLSDDDIVLDGGIARVVEHLDLHPDIGFFFLNLRSFVGRFDPGVMRSPVLPAKTDLRFEDASSFIAYCWIWLTMMSGFVFKRTTWMIGDRHGSYIGTDIYLSYALFDHLSIDPAAMLVADPIIAVRAHYSGSYRIFYAFAYQWRRLLLEHGVQRGFDPNVMRRTFLRSVRNDLLGRIVFYRADTGELDAESRQAIALGTRGLGVDTAIVRLAVGLPRPVLRGARNAARWVRHRIIGRG